jgi:hypothetical protein
MNRFFDNLTLCIIDDYYSIGIDNLIGTYDLNIIIDNLIDILKKKNPYPTIIEKN